MTKLLPLLLSVTFFCVQVLGGGLSPSSNDQICFYAIYTSFASLTWPSDAGHISRRSTSTTQCTSTVEVTSLYASSKEYCTGDQFDAGLVFWTELCQSVKATLIDLNNVSATVTEAYVEKLPVSDPDTGSKSVTSPILLSRPYYQRAYKTYVAKANNKPRAKHYGWGIMGFWGGVVLMGILANIWNTFLPTPSSMIPHWIRTNLIVPAAFGAHHQRRFLWCTIPKRLDLTIVFCFWSLCIILSCVNYGAFSGNITLTTISQQIWNYLPVRMGVFAYNCLPWVWLFAGRNNIFIWATGWSYRTFNIFHRHCARAMVVFGIVHAIGYTVKYTVYSPGKYTADLAQKWFVMGIVALVLMATLVGFSSAWIRAKYYEVFLMTHIILSIVILYSLFAHTSDEFEKEFDGYTWPPVALWAFDRAVRIVRLVYCNLHVRFSSQVIKTSSALVSYSSEQDVIRIEVYPGSSMLKPAPGQYYHLYQPFTLRGWENHPFTLGAYSTGSEPAQVLPSEDMEKGAAVDVSKSSSSPESSLQGEGATRLTFYVRPYDGWTKRLRNQCIKSNGITRQKLFIEGPYGHKAPIHRFDTVVMITGGTGISSALPYILDDPRRASTGVSKTTKMQLVWAAKQDAFIQDLCSKELAPALSRPDFEGTFFHTAANGPVYPVSDSDEIAPVESKTASLAQRHIVEVQCGRPDIRKIIGGAAIEAKTHGTSVVVLVCGPATMADETRAAVHAELKAGCRTMEYVEDAFGW